MDSVTIRRATLEDLKAVQELNNYLFELEKEKYDPTLAYGFNAVARESDGKE